MPRKPVTRRKVNSSDRVIKPAALSVSQPTKRPNTGGPGVPVDALAKNSNPDGSGTTEMMQVAENPPSDGSGEVEI